MSGTLVDECALIIRAPLTQGLHLRNTRTRPEVPLGSLTLTFAAARELPSIWRHTKEFGGLSSAAGGPFRGAPLWGWAIFHKAVTTAIEVDMLYALIAAAHRTGTNGDELQHAS